MSFSAHLHFAHLLIPLNTCTHSSLPPSVRQKNRTCRDPTCTYGKRTQPIHLITGLCLPFWKELKKCVVSGVKMGCKVVRVQPDQGQRLVGILVQQSKLEEVKAIIRRGTQSDVGIEDRSQRMVDSPFYEETKVVKLHDCLNPTGLDGINFELPSGWQESGDGAGSKLFIQIYEIPFQVRGFVPACLRICPKHSHKWCSPLLSLPPPISLISECGRRRRRQIATLAYAVAQRHAALRPQARHERPV